MAAWRVNGNRTELDRTAWRGCRSAYQTRGGGAPVESPVPARRAALRRSSATAWGSRSCPAAAGIGTGCGCGSLRGASGRRRRLERRGRRWRRREVELRASLGRRALQRFISLTVQYKIPLLVLGSSSSQPFPSSQESSMWDFDEDPLTHQPLPPRLLEGPWDGRKRAARRAGARGGHRHADGGPGVWGDDG